MSQKRYVARSMQVAARRLGDETMIMSGKDSTLFTLNEVATLIWEAADGRMALDEIVEQNVCPAFDVEPEAALRDAEAFAEDLAEHGILVLSDQPILSNSAFFVRAAAQGAK